MLNIASRYPWNNETHYFIPRENILPDSTFFNASSNLALSKSKSLVTKHDKLTQRISASGISPISLIVLNHLLPFACNICTFEIFHASARLENSCLSTHSFFDHYK